MQDRLCEEEIEEIWLRRAARLEAIRQAEHLLRLESVDQPPEWAAALLDAIDEAQRPDSAEEYLADAWAMVLGACVVAGLGVVVGLLLGWWALHV